MTREKALKAVMDKADEMGLENTYDVISRICQITAKVWDRYVRVSIIEQTDFDSCDFERGIYAGHFEASAAVRRMGGNPDADELLDAAEQIRLAAEFVKACGRLNFSFREDMHGNEA